MKEIDIENLDRMFPNGYLIIYTCDDDQIRMGLFNPYKDSTIEGYHKMLKDKGAPHAQ